MGRFLLVTGTGTGVGKTMTAAFLAAVEVRRGRSVAVVKPAQTGVDARAEGDAQTVARFVPGVAVSELARFAPPLRLQPLVEHAVTLADTCDCVLIEGAGGISVPLGEGGFTLAEVASALSRQGPVEIVVACGAELGTLNQAVLTCEYLRARGLEPAGLVVGSYPAQPGLAEVRNLEDLPRFTGVPLLQVAVS